MSIYNYVFSGDISKPLSLSIITQVFIFSKQSVIYFNPLWVSASLFRCRLSGLSFLIYHDWFWCHTISQCKWMQIDNQLSKVRGMEWKMYLTACVKYKHSRMQVAKLISQHFKLHPLSVVFHILMDLVTLKNRVSDHAKRILSSKHRADATLFKLTGLGSCYYFTWYVVFISDIVTVIFIIDRRCNMLEIETEIFIIDIQHFTLY